jgi:hypothetical protein
MLLLLTPGCSLALQSGIQHYFWVSFGQNQKNIQNISIQFLGREKWGSCNQVQSTSSDSWFPFSRIFRVGDVYSAGAGSRRRASSMVDLDFSTDLGKDRHHNRSIWRAPRVLWHLHLGKLDDVFVYHLGVSFFLAKLWVLFMLR